MHAGAVAPGCAPQAASPGCCQHGWDGMEERSRDRAAANSWSNVWRRRFHAYHSAAKYSFCVRWRRKDLNIRTCLRCTCNTESLISEIPCWCYSFSVLTCCLCRTCGCSPTLPAHAKLANTQADNKQINKQINNKLFSLLLGCGSISTSLLSYMGSHCSCRGKVTEVRVLWVRCKRS